MIKLLGGGADTDNALVYFSENYIATTTFNKDNNNFETKIDKNYFTRERFYNHIPLLRGVINHFMQGYIKGNIVTIDGKLIFVPIIYLVDKIYFHLNIMSYVYILFILFIIFVVSKNKEVTKLHGAEHKCCNFYTLNKSINNSDIEDIKKTSAYHKDCGTNFYMFHIMIFLIFQIFFKDFMICYFLDIAVVYEIIKYNKNYIIFKPLFMVGRYIQLNMFIREPSENQIKMAIQTIQELEKVEEK